MDSLTFVVRMTEALAWPIAAVVALFVVRRPLSGLVGAVGKLKYKGFVAEFSKNVVRLETSAAASLPQSQAAATSPLLSSDFARMAEEAPRAAIVQAWLTLSGAAIDALKRSGLALELRASYSPDVIEVELEKRGILNAEQLAVLKQLRELNVTASKAPVAPSPGDALQYAMTAFRFADLLRGWKRA